jgi:hypothetical protein
VHHQLGAREQRAALRVRQAVGVVRVHVRQQHRVHLFRPHARGRQVALQPPGGRRHGVAAAGVHQRHPAAGVDEEGVHRRPPRHRPEGVAQHPRGLLRRDVLEDGHGPVQVAVAHGRHDGVADAPVVDSRHLPVGHAGHAPLLLLGRPAG